MLTGLSTTLAGLSFPSNLMNASGAWSGTHEELREVASSAAGAVVIKITTTQARVEEVQGCGLESSGQLYDPGVLAELRAPGKPVVGSVTGFTTAESVELARAYARAGVQIVELNLSDPIVPGNRCGTCDLTAVDAVVQAVHAAVQVPLAVKLPGLPEAAIGQTVDLLRRHRIEVFLCNTPLLAAFEPAISGTLDLIAVGGIANDKDAQGALSCGANAVQIGSVLMKEGPAVFASVQHELTVERAMHEAGA